MNSALIKQTLSDYKNKIYSNIGTFLIMAAVYLIIIIPCFTCTIGHGYNNNNFFSYLTNGINVFSGIIILPTALISIIFSIIYSIRNNYLNTLSMSSSRKSYLLSDIGVAITFSAILSIVEIIGECIIRLIISNSSGNFLFLKGEYSSGVSFTLQNAFTAMFFCIAVFFIITSFANCIVRKKWGMLVINLLIIAAYFLIVMLPLIIFENTVITSASFKKFIEGYYTFTSSWYGLSIIAFSFSAIYQSINFIYLNKGGFRR